MKELTLDERDALQRFSAKIHKHIRPQIVHFLDIAIIISRKDAEAIKSVIDDLLVNDLAKKRVSTTEIEK